jgi:hypothetical protein
MPTPRTIRLSWVALITLLPVMLKIAAEARFEDQLMYLTSVKRTFLSFLTVYKSSHHGWGAVVIERPNGSERSLSGRHLRNKTALNLRP